MIARRSVLTVANLVVGSVLGLVALKLASLYFGPFYMGQATFAMSILGLLAFMTDLGMGAAHVKRVSEGRDPGDCFATYAAYKIVVTGLFVAIILGMLATYLFVLDKPLESTTAPIVLITLAYYVTRSFSEMAASSFDAQLETAKSQAAQLADTLVRVGLTAFAALVLGGVVLATSGNAIVGWIRANPGEAYALTTTLGSAVAMTLSIVMLRRAMAGGRFRWDLLRDYARFALPLFLAGAVSLVAFYIDGAVLGYFKSETEAGIFGGIRRLPLMLAGFSAAVNVLLFPTISAMIARGDSAGVNVTANRAMRYLSMMLVPMCVFVIAFAAPLVRVGLSAPFLPGTLALQLMVVYVLVQALGNVHSLLLMGANMPAVAARIGVGFSLALIALDLVLVPDDIRSLGVRLGGLGVTGAALATLLAGLIWYGALRLATERHLGFRENTGLWKHVAASLLMAVALLAIDRTLMPLERWYSFLLFIPLGALIYAAALAALRELTRADVAFLREAVHPGEMLRYVQSELFHRRK